MAETTKITVDGIDLLIDESVTDDFRFMRLMRESQKNALAAVDVLDQLVGVEQMAVVESHFEDPETGRVPLDAMTGFLEAVFEGLKDAKN
jgi:hypothetical protein